MSLKLVIACAVPVLLLGACVENTTATPSAVTDPSMATAELVCDNGVTQSVTLTGDDYALIDWNGKTQKLARKVTGSGAGYENKVLEIHYKGDNWLLTDHSADDAVTRCTSH